MTTKEVTKNIICIDDREQDIHLLKRVLERELKDVHLVSFTDPEEARKKILDGSISHLNPSLIFIDLKMPKVSGFDILESLKQKSEYKNLPKIILSSSSQKSDIDKAYQLCCSSYVEKPSNYPKLKDTISHTVTYWLHYNKQ